MIRPSSAAIRQRRMGPADRPASRHGRFPSPDEVGDQRRQEDRPRHQRHGVPHLRGDPVEQPEEQSPNDECNIKCSFSHLDPPSHPHGGISLARPRQEPVNPRGKTPLALASSSRVKSRVSAHLKPRKSGPLSSSVFSFVLLKKRQGLWTLVGISRSSARFPSRCGRVLCVHSGVSVRSLFAGAAESQYAADAAGEVRAWSVGPPDPR